MTPKSGWASRAGVRFSTVARCVVLLTVGLVGLSACGGEDAAQPLTSVAKLPDPIHVSGSPNGGIRILYVGDSITRGSGASSYADSFRELTTATLRESVAVDEQMVAKGGARLSEVARMAVPVPPADVVLVQLGTNDVLSPVTPIADFAGQYRTLIGAVRAVNPHAALICLGLWRPAASAGPFDSVIHDECASDRARFLPMSDLFDGEGLRGPTGRAALGRDGLGDDFHPNDFGHRSIAHRVVGIVQLDNGAAA